MSEKMSKKEAPISSLTTHCFEGKITKAIKIRYLLFLPKDYGRTTARWPLIIFLHGAGEAGDDLDAVRRVGLMEYVKNQKDFPFIVAAPQIPKGDWWYHHVDDVMLMLDDILIHYDADPERIYLTGLSLGGYGTWDIASKYPERFAAIVPICGGGMPDVACKLKDMPIWAFHGAKDDIVQPWRSEKMVEAINKCGGNAKLTIYPDGGHNVWSQTYSNIELYDWLLKYSKKQEKK